MREQFLIPFLQFFEDVGVGVAAGLYGRRRCSVSDVVERANPWTLWVSNRNMRDLFDI